MRTKRYKINLKKQIAYIASINGFKPKNVACKLWYKHGKHFCLDNRNVLQIKVFECDGKFKKAKGNSNSAIIYSVDKNGYAYLPQSITKHLVYGGKYGENKYSMIFLFDQKDTKVFIPWLNQKGGF